MRASLTRSECANQGFCETRNQVEKLLGEKTYAAYCIHTKRNTLVDPAIVT
jgi:hypothetical protein